MDFETAKQLFEELVELCYETGIQQLIEVIEPIYRDLDRATDLSHVINLAHELQVRINELELITPEEEDAVQDMHELIEKLSE